MAARGGRERRWEVRLVNDDDGTLPMPSGGARFTWWVRRLASRAMKDSGNASSAACQSAKLQPGSLLPAQSFGLGKAPRRCCTSVYAGILTLTDVKENTLQKMYRMRYLTIYLEHLL